ncbi:uncharacterized protein E0L32_007073 [Thyridium curvatum]|uniref:Major facilitator superfamily (MFS) profile domain-containing protein n=1 Tax=Thyridium curvatum TaxID=1093900 RepID=A0A507AXG2_9PEZI|nr:uncharacterized protein E0L32_007073 [Thyridium curvatum]TPX12187.1 hypothetical protein E0L32_007073 [Thyridium curvatum]
MLFKKSKAIARTPGSITESKATTETDPQTANGAPGKEDTQTAPLARKESSGDVYPSGVKLFVLLTSVYVSMFLVALDRLIITTAIPRITDDFHSVTDIGWYGSAFLLTSSSFQLLFGKVYKFFSVKVTLLATIVLFEIGSAISGAAPNSIAFIIGRAISGLGAAGILSGLMMTIVYSVPLHKRPLYQGMMGGVFGIASVVGPLLGGVFTSKVTWRWCFYINLPLGGVAMVVIFFLLKIPERKETQIPLKAKLAQLDVYGTGLIVPGTICLLLALQWGGLTYAWSDGRIIALLVLAGVLIIGFIMVQILLPKTATIAPRIFKQRSILAGFFCTLCLGPHMMLFVYYLPVWFQAIQGLSAVDSGIHLLPLVLSMVAANIASGAAVRRIGYYTPFLIAGTCLASVGAGLLNTLSVTTPLARLAGYQVLYGLGLGLMTQAPNVAAQTVLPRPDVPIGTTLVFFTQTLAGAVFLSVGQNVLQGELLRRLPAALGGGGGSFDPKTIADSGATSLTDLPDAVRPAVLRAYNEALRQVFRMALVLTCLTILGALAMEWRSTRQEVEKKQAPREEEAVVAPATASTEEARVSDTRDSSIGEKQSTVDGHHPHQEEKSKESV